MFLSPTGRFSARAAKLLAWLITLACGLGCNLGELALAQGDSFLGKSPQVWVDALSSSSEPLKRKAAAFALGKLAVSNFDAVPALRQALEREKDALVREAILFALADVAPAKMQNQADHELQRLASLALMDSEWTVRRGAAFALARFGEPDQETLVRLTKCLSDGKANVRQNAAAALVRQGEQAVKPLASALADSEAEVRRDAAHSLADLADPYPEGVRRVLPSLLRASRDADSEVKKKALVALGKIVEPRDAAAAPVLQEALNDGDEEIRRQAALTLSNIGQQAARPAVKVLQQMLRTGTPTERRDAALALNNLGPYAEPALQDLLQTLAQGEAPLRQNSALALGSIGKAAEPAVRPLLDILTNRNEIRDLRLECAESLSRLGALPEVTRVIPSILPVMLSNDEDGEIRVRLAWVFNSYVNVLGDHPDVLRSFLRLCDERPTQDNIAVRYHVAYLLALHHQTKTPPQTLNVLSEWLRNDSFKFYLNKQSAVGAASQETAGGGASVKSVLKSDGRAIAVMALRAVGSQLVNGRRDIVEQLRALNRNPATEELLRKEIRGLFKDLQIAP